MAEIVYTVILIIQLKATEISGIEKMSLKRNHALHLLHEMSFLSILGYQGVVFELDIKQKECGNIFTLLSQWIAA